MYDQKSSLYLSKGPSGRNVTQTGRRPTGPEFHSPELDEVHDLFDIKPSREGRTRSRVVWVAQTDKGYNQGYPSCSGLALEGRRWTHPTN